MMLIASENGVNCMELK